LLEVIVVVTNPFRFAGGTYFVNDTVEQIGTKQLVENEMREWECRQVARLERLDIDTTKSVVGENSCYSIEPSRSDPRPLLPDGVFADYVY
jgi:hypothetical protein